MLLTRCEGQRLASLGQVQHCYEARNSQGKRQKKFRVSSITIAELETWVRRVSVYSKGEVRLTARGVMNGKDSMIFEHSTPNLGKAPFVESVDGAYGELLLAARVPGGCCWWLAGCDALQ